MYMTPGRFAGKLLPLVLALTVLCGCDQQPPPQSHETDWPVFRGNSAQTGFAQSGLPDKLKLLWTHEAGRPVESTAAIVGETVFVGTDGGKLLALSRLRR